MSNNICDDLMKDIFKRLPPKSIIRFRSLSKHWHSYLITPEFLHDHRLRCSKSPQKVIVNHLSYCGNSEFKNMYSLHSGDQLPFGPGSGRKPVPGFEFPHDVEVVGSCNGIVCLLGSTQLILCNFSVRRKLIVPCHPCLKFHLVNFKVVLGFGYDEINDDYKIVAIDRYHNDTLIYSLKTDSWSVFCSPSDLIDQTAYKLRSYACFFNGILYWNVDSHLLLTFNVSSHVYGRVLLPLLCHLQQITIINGFLAVIYYDSRSSESSWKIWVMKGFYKFGYWSRLVAFEARSSREVRVVQPLTNGDVVAYDEGPTRDDLYMISESGNSKAKFLKMGIERYVESLELLDKERATTCRETIFTWSKMGVKYYTIQL